MMGHIVGHTAGASHGQHHHLHHQLVAFNFGLQSEYDMRFGTCVVQQKQVAHTFEPLEARRDK